jgi:hypothetical protein
MLGNGENSSPLHPSPKYPQRYLSPANQWNRLCIPVPFLLLNQLSGRRRNSWAIHNP